MPCYSPMIGVAYSWTKNGKPNYKFSSKVFSDPVHHYWFYNDSQQVAPPISVPCGKCIGCRLDHSRMWADRCMLELGDHEQSWFITLTYNNEHLPVVFDDEYPGTLVKKDFQDFMKRLRKAYCEKYDNKIRYFMCGEYGDQFHRPHYHAIIFGLKLDDLVVNPDRASNEFGQPYYYSQWLQDVWTLDNKPLGKIMVANVTWETCAYVARYVTKKVDGEMSVEQYQSHHVAPEFTLMSRKPGIGKNYFDNHKFELLSSKYWYISTPNGGKKIQPSRYFLDKFSEEFPKEFADLKAEKLSSAQDRLDQELLGTSLHYQDELYVKQRNKKAAAKSLRRCDV